MLTEIVLALGYNNIDRRLPANETEHSQTRKERKTRNRAPHVALVSVLSINNAINECVYLFTSNKLCDRAQDFELPCSAIFSSPILYAKFKVQTHLDQGHSGDRHYFP